MTKKTNTRTVLGVADDPRNKYQKQLDYRHEDLFGASTFEWKEFNDSEIPRHNIRNQNGSSECVAFSVCKALGRNNQPFKDLRPEYIYTKRANRGEGMWLQNAFDIAVKYGAPEDPELKGDNLTEAQANAYTPTPEETAQALKYRGKNYVFINKDNIDEIARVIEQGHTPIFLVRCDITEWTSEPTVNNSKTSPFNINHAVPAVYAGIRNGVKTIVISDSWGSSYGKNGLRYISEDFIKTRVETVGYIVDLPDEVIPKFVFNKDLYFGMRNSDVLLLQKRLVKEGFATFTPTGYFGLLTQLAVIKYQKAKGITPSVGFVGKITRESLNS
jgi:hypothetical protein